MSAFPHGSMRRSVWSAIALSAVLVSGTVIPAQADPNYPSKDDVNHSKQQAADTAGQISVLEQALVQANQDLEDAQVAEQVAAEDYDDAVARLDEKKKAVADAEAAVTKAKQAAADAKTDVGQLAADAYRSGGINPGMSALLDKNGAQDVLSRYDTISRLGSQRDKVFQKAQADDSIAANLEAQADAAKKEQQKATEAKEKAAKAAAAASAAAVAQVKTTEDTRAGLIDQLAQINHRTVQLEQQYQAGVEAARQAAIEKAAREKVEAEERAEKAREKAAADKKAREEREAQEKADRAARDAQEKADRDNKSDKADDSAPPVKTGSSNTPPPTKPSGGGKKPGKAPSTPSGHKSGSSTAISWAKTKLGIPYLWGGTGPRYDCSGLTMRAWQAAGVNIPRTSRAQYAGLSKVSIGNMRPGDLIFYSSNGTGSGIHHVTMYIGNGKMIEAPHTGSVVRIVSVRYSGGIMPRVARP